MFVQSILIPYILGIVTNKTSQDLFEREELALIIQDIYHKSEDEFNREYPNSYGGKFNNFLARQENKDLLLKHALNYGENIRSRKLNEVSFEGDITPDEVVNEFLIIFHKNINEDDRLIEYRNVREHYLLTKEIIKEIKGLKEIYIKKFEHVLSIIGSYAKVQPYITNRTQDDIDNIIKSLDEKDIVLIDSYRGFGKSETLYQAALSNKLEGKFDNILVMKHGVRNIFDALQTEIIESESYLILVDDIDLCISEFTEVLNFLKVSKSDFKIIATTQTYMLNEIKDIITKKSLYKSSIFISLNTWSKQDFIELLRATASKACIEDEELIVAKYPSPSLISWIGRNNNTKVEKVEDLFVGYLQTMRTDTYEILKDILSQQECDRLIFNISCLVPFKLEEDCGKSVEQIIGVKEGDFHKIIRRLEAGGVLRKISDKYRFFPDIKGDIYLAYSLRDGLFPEDLLYWLNESQEKVLSNINETRFICKINIDEIFKPLIAEWSKADEYFSQSNILEKAINIVEFVPESVLNLIYCYLIYAIKEKGNKYCRLTTDNFGPLLKSLWRYSNNKEGILEFLRLCENHNLDGMYDNYKVKGIVKDSFSPLYSQIETINEGLDILHTWLCRNTDKALVIFEYALAELLKGSHEVTKAIINGIQFGQRYIYATPEIIKVREKSIEIINYILNDKFTYECVQAIEKICDSLGEVRWGSDGGEELPLYKEITRERSIMVDILGAKLLSSNDIACNIVLERVLIKWWALQKVGSEKASEYLIAFHHSPEYLFAKYHVDADYRIISFEEVNKMAPSDDRWLWYVDNIISNDDNIDDEKKIAGLLNGHISSIEELSRLLNDTTSIIKQMRLCWSTPNILSHWGILNYKLFIEYMSSHYYNETDGYFRGDLLRIVTINDIHLGKEFIERLLGRQDKISTEEIEFLLNILSNKLIDDESVIVILEKIIYEDRIQNPASLTHKLYFIFKERNRKLLINVLIIILKKYTFDTSLCHMIYFVTKQFIDELRTSDRFIELKNIILDKLTEIYKFDYHENSMLEILLDNSEEALNFVVNRLSTNKEVPYHGFTFLKSFIKEINEYQKLVTILIDMEIRGIVNQYDKNGIYEALFLTRNKEGKLISTELLTKYISEENLSGVLEMLEYFRLFSDTLSPFVQGIIYLDRMGKLKEIESLLIKHTNPYGGWTRSTGSHSPEIVNRIELFREMYDTLPFGKIKIVVERCIGQLERQMKMDLINDEEVFNPR
jgi:hypothetical protein